MVPGDEPLLPIKIVLPREGDIRHPESSGRAREPLEAVTSEMRQRLVDQIEELRSAAHNWFTRYPELPAVGRVVLKEKALAKSHRPTKLFNERTCPIIGVKGLGELLVEVREEGLDSLRHEIAEGRTKAHEHDISVIEKILPYGPHDVLSPSVADKVRKVVREKRGPLKVELFSFPDSRTNHLVEERFEKFLKDIGCSLTRRLRYAPSLILMEVMCPDVKSLETLCSFIAIRRLSFFSRYRALQPMRLNADPALPPEHLHPVEGMDYPVVAVVDGGIAENHPALAPWIIEREVYVPQEYRNPAHGTFVAGIVVHGHLLNPGTTDDVPGCKLVDVVVLPNGDRDAGSTDTVDEQTFLERLRDAIGKHRHLARVWNLSLGLDTEEECSIDSISDLAVALDALADEYDVCFVIAAGNYEGRPLRAWPPQPRLRDRITPPADSIRGITVGAVPGVEAVGSLVGMYDPAPYSRRGPGPFYIVKPELVHVGGNCREDGTYNGMGIRSWDVDGNLTEGIGTSFSTPRVSRLLAAVFASVDPPPSANLAKALLIHSARLPGRQGRPSGDDLHYFGFGMPESLRAAIACSPSAITMIWEGEVVPGAVFAISDFPYPRCLYWNERWHGEVWMTLVYDPPLDRKGGFEYCRLNLDASLGVFRQRGDKLEYEPQVPPEATWKDRYERQLIENGFKWAPVKVYRRNLRKGVTGEGWRLTIRPLLRSGESSTAPQRFVLIVTIADPEHRRDVYTDVVQQLQKRFPIRDLVVKERVRTRIGLGPVA